MNDSHALLFCCDNQHSCFSSLLPKVCGSVHFEKDLRSFAPRQAERRKKSVCTYFLCPTFSFSRLNTHKSMHLKWERRRWIISSKKAFSSDNQGHPRIIINLHTFDAVCFWIGQGCFSTKDKQTNNFKSILDLIVHFQLMEYVFRFSNVSFVCQHKHKN